MRPGPFSVLLFLSLLTSAAVAQKGSVQTPVSTAEDAKSALGKLSFLVGKFTTTTEVLPAPSMPKGGKGTGTAMNQWGLDSMFVVVNEESMNSLLGSYKGHGMLGYSPVTKKYHLSMFNNFGDHPEYEGVFAGDTLILTTKVAARAGSFDQQLKWFRAAGVVRLQVFNDRGTGPRLVVDQTSTPQQ
jgi:hypothetical protein